GPRNADVVGETARQCCRSEPEQYENRDPQPDDQLAVAERTSTESIQQSCHGDLRFTVGKPQKWADTTKLAVRLVAFPPGWLRCDTANSRWITCRSASTVNGMAAQEQQERSRVDTRARLLATALELFGEYGVDATSLQMIANALGVTKAAVYYHFRTKAEITEAVAAP